VKKCHVKFNGFGNYVMMTTRKLNLQMKKSNSCYNITYMSHYSVISNMEIPYNKINYLEYLFFDGVINFLMTS